MLKKILLVVCFSILIADASARPKKKNLEHQKMIDQSQEGQWNVRADLENFLILLVPANDESSSASSLMNFLLRSASPGKFRKGMHNRKQQKGGEFQETKHFIESKTAPYQVDISKSTHQLSTATSEDTLVANSPSISLVKKSIDGAKFIDKLKKIARNSKAILLTVNADKNVESTPVV